MAERARLEEVARCAARVAAGVRELGIAQPWALRADLEALNAALAARRDQPCPRCAAPQRATLAEWAAKAPCQACGEE